MAETVATTRNVPRFRTNRYPGFTGGGGIQEDVAAPAPVAIPATSFVPAQPTTQLARMVPNFGDGPDDPQGLQLEESIDPLDQIMDPGIPGRLGLGIIGNVALGINNAAAVNRARQEAGEPLDWGKLASGFASPQSAIEEVFGYQALERDAFGFEHGGDGGGGGDFQDVPGSRLNDIQALERDAFGFEHGGGGGGGGETSSRGDNDSPGSGAANNSTDNSDSADNAFRSGGLVTASRLSGPDPKGPDDGSAYLDIGEFIIPSDVVKEIGADRFRKLIADVRAQKSKGKQSA